MDDDNEKNRWVSFAIVIESLYEYYGQFKYKLDPDDIGTEKWNDFQHEMIQGLEAFAKTGDGDQQEEILCAILKLDNRFPMLGRLLRNIRNNSGLCSGGLVDVARIDEKVAEPVSQSSLQADARDASRLYSGEFAMANGNDESKGLESLSPSMDESASIETYTHIKGENYAYIEHLDENGNFIPYTIMAKLSDQLQVGEAGENCGWPGRCATA